MTVRDYGRGIPLGKVIDCVSKVNTGGKFNDDVFQFSVGLNGIGTKAVNALSAEFEVVSFREGKFVQGLFKEGKLACQKEGKDPKAKNGSSSASPRIPRSSPRTPGTTSSSSRRLRYYAYLNSGLKFLYNGETVVSQGGLLDLLVGGDRRGVHALRDRPLQGRRTWSSPSPTRPTTGRTTSAS